MVEDILIYHARNYKKIVGDPLNDPNRHTRVQILHWNDDETPNFGEPVPDGFTPGERFGFDDVHPYYDKRTSLQVVELEMSDGAVCCDRDRDFDFRLTF